MFQLTLRYGVRSSALCLLLLAGCREPIPGQISEPPPALALDPIQADVWSLSVDLVGHVPDGQPPLQDCELERDTPSAQPQPEIQRYRAQVAGSSFFLRMPLPPARDSSVWAICHDVRGRSLYSPSVRLSSKLSRAPNARASAKIQQGRLLLDASASSPNEGTAAQLLEAVWFRASAAGLLLSPLGVGTRLTLPLPQEAGEHRYALRVEDAEGNEDVAQIALVVDGAGARFVDEAGPSWIDQAVVYGAVPRLFGEPAFEKLTDALDGLRALGVDTLWLSPVFQGPSDDFGYAVTDFFRVQSDYGDRTTFDGLIRAAHARGMRVLLDLVISHSSAQHPYFRDAQARGSRSHYFHFYARDATGAPTHDFDWQDLPNFDLTNPEVVRFVQSISDFWLGAGADGYRVDTAWAVRQRAPGFYPGWSAALHRQNPDILLLAEASARDPYYLQNGFDAAYDWTDQLGEHAWDHVFDDAHGIAARLATAVLETQKRTARPERTFRYLNNNDTGKRFISKHGLGLTRAATVALLTLPGIPCLYAFDEVGAEFEPYRDFAPIHHDDLELRAFHRDLIALRKRSGALHGPGLRMLDVGKHDELLVYLRSGRRAHEQALVAINFSNQPVTRELTLPGELAGKALVDGLTQRTFAPHSLHSLQLPAYGAVVLEAAP